MTNFSASLTNLTPLLPQSRANSCYVIRPILAPPPLWMQKYTDLRAQVFAHSPDLWHQPRLANDTCAWSWTLCRITPAIIQCVSVQNRTVVFKLSAATGLSTTSLHCGGSEKTLMLGRVYATARQLNNQSRSSSIQIEVIIGFCRSHVHVQSKAVPNLAN